MSSYSEESPGTREDDIEVFFYVVIVFYFQSTKI